MTAKGAIVHDSYMVSIPADWIVLPTHGEPVQESLDAVVAGFDLPVETADRLRSALAAVTRLAQAGRRDGRTDWALVRNVASGRVDAMVSLELLLGSEDAFERYRDAISSEPIERNDVELIKRVVSEQLLPAGPAVVVHEFDLPTGDYGATNPAVERSVVALFPRRFDKVFEFVLVTQDLGLYEDASEYLAQVAAQVRVVTEDEQP